MTSHPSIFLIEDSPGECELFRMALVQTGVGLSLHTESDIERALRFLAQSSESGTLPSIILLDLKLRKRHGLDFLKQLRANVPLTYVPVIVFTTSDAPADLAACYAAGATSYVVKPGTFENLVRFVSDLSHYWIRWNRSPYRVETRC